MTDIFISYARSTAAQAQIVAEALRRLGYGVWRDDELPAHRAYAEVIEERLRAARAVVVVWSAEAVKSQWVRAEANLAREAGTLVQLRIDDCTLPLPFNEIQCADLSGWSGNADAPGWQRVLESVDHLCGTERAQPAPVASAPSPVSPPTSLRSMLKRPVVLGGLTAAALAVVGITSFLLTRTPSSPPISAADQRVAFFGYTVNGADPSGGSATLARSATDKMFQSLRAIALDVAAPTETLDTPKDKQFAKAAALGARYALSGEVRSEQDRRVLSVRLEDVGSRTNLWERSFAAPSRDEAYLPALAAWPTYSVIRCIVRVRAALTRDAPNLVRLAADFCREGGYVKISDFGETIASTSWLRELVHADPKSAGLQYRLARFLSVEAWAASASARPALIAEAEAALARAKLLDPKDPTHIEISVRIANAKSEPLADYDARLSEALPKLEGGDLISFSGVNTVRFWFQASVGRWREAAETLAALAASDPANSTGSYGLALANALKGQSGKARTEFEAGFATFPFISGWSQWAGAAIFLGAGDSAKLLKSPPSFIPQSTVECFRDVRQASLSWNPATRKLGAERAVACADRGDFSRADAVFMSAALGDLDRAFDRLAREPRQNALTVLKTPVTAVLFWPTSRALRADPRFLPLVERLGLMDYWRATKTQPDVCETEDVPFCRELKKTLATKH